MFPFKCSTNFLSEQHTYDLRNISACIPWGLKKREGFFLDFLILK